MSKEIKIIEDSESEMLQMTIEDECIFEGNYWDFDRSGENFRRLFEYLGFKVSLEEKDYDTWY